jgi:hypothetical protein
LLLKAEILDNMYQSDSRIGENFTGSYKDALKIYNLDQINAPALLDPCPLGSYPKSKKHQA